MPLHPDNSMSLKEAVMRALAECPGLNRRQILERIAHLGYKFKTANPHASLSSMVYSEKETFRSDGGRFSLRDEWLVVGR